MTVRWLSENSVPVKFQHPQSPWPAAVRRRHSVVRETVGAVTSSSAPTEGTGSLRLPVIVGVVGSVALGGYWSAPCSLP